MVVLYTFSRFGKLYRENSGNPVVSPTQSELSVFAENQNPFRCKLATSQAEKTTTFWIIRFEDNRALELSVKQLS
jgi:hypothetical protein